MMRLRLQIQRHELPTVSVVWPITGDGCKQTIAQFLAQVNERFPLEGNTWGLEDYIVAIGGYEVLHYHEIGLVCKEEDEVVIRPLSYTELRARTLSGRAQITRDGRHLVDGIPFGKPSLKRTARPDVHLPPRKRQRKLDSAEETEIAYREPLDPQLSVVTTAPGLTSGHGPQHDSAEEDEDADDADFLPEHDNAAVHGSNAPSGATMNLRRRTCDTSRGSQNVRRQERSVAFIDSDAASSENSTSDIVEDDASTELSNSEDAMETSSDDSTSESSDPSSSDDDTSSDSDDSASTSEGSQNVLREKMVAPASRVTASCSHRTQEEKFVGVPGAGRPETKARNQRRQLSKKLAIAKKYGRLPPNATIKDYREWKQDDPKQYQSDSSRPTTLHNKPTETELSMGVAPPPSAGELANAAANEAKASQIQDQRQRLLDDIASGGIDVGKDYENTGKSSKLRESQSDLSAIVAESQEPSKLKESKRRLDLASSTRMLFGHLGHRAPKNQAEREKLQLIMEQSARRPAATQLSEAPVAAEEETKDAEDPDMWRDKLSISAIECCDEGVTLCPPPFPFRQRWDPQYSSKKNKRNSTLYSNTRGKKRKIAAEYDGAYVETYDKYNTNGSGDALNYDDEEDIEYWEEGALLDGADGHGDDQEQAELQLLAEAAAEQQAKDDFPLLPADLSALTDLTADDATVGDFIVFTELDCSAATNWQPSMVTRSALLQSKEGDEWTIKLAPRDLPAKKYDGDGNRIYEKFETEDDDIDEADRDVCIVDWHSMVGPKLLLRPVPNPVED